MNAAIALPTVNNATLKNLTTDWWYMTTEGHENREEPSTPAYCIGEYWNGWACPLMTREQLRAMIALEKSLMDYTPDNPANIWEEDGKFWSLDPEYFDGGTEHTEIEPTHQLPDGTPLYNLNLGLCFSWAE